MVAVGAARMQRLNPRPHRSDALPGKEKAAPKGRLFDQTGLNSALACLEPALCLVDHVDTALAAHHAAVAMTGLQRTKRVPDFHALSPIRGAGSAVCLCHKPVAVNGGRYWDRTSDPFDVNEVLYR